MGLKQVCLVVDVLLTCVKAVDVRTRSYRKQICLGGNVRRLCRDGSQVSLPHGGGSIRICEGFFSHRYADSIVPFTGVSSMII